LTYNCVRQEGAITNERLEVRLDPERRWKLTKLAEERKAPVSEVVLRLIDNAYEEVLAERRRVGLARMLNAEVEDVPGPDELSRQLDGTHDLPDLY